MEAGDVCCVCGCEDNEDFETMIHPVNDHVCDGGSVLAHPACMTAAQNLSHRAWNGKARAAGLCQLCGDRFLKSPVANEEFTSHTSSGGSQSKSHKGSTSPNQLQSRNSRRSVKVDQSSRGAKRLRSALTNGVPTVKPEPPEKWPLKTIKDEDSHVHATQSGEKMDLTLAEASKVGTAVLGRRFNDPTVTVPIKKRRLHMIEPSRSPSPPPRAHSPLTVVPKKESKLVVQTTDDLEMVEVSSLGDASTSAIGENLDTHTLGRDNGNKQPSLEEKKMFDSDQVVDRKDGRFIGTEVALVSNKLGLADKDFRLEMGEGNKQCTLEGRKVLYPQQDLDSRIAGILVDGAVTVLSNEVAPVDTSFVPITIGLDASLQSTSISSGSKVGFNIVEAAHSYGVDGVTHADMALITGKGPAEGNVRSGVNLKFSENGSLEPESVSMATGHQGHQKDYHEGQFGPSKEAPGVEDKAFRPILLLGGNFEDAGHVFDIQESSGGSGYPKISSVVSSIDASGLQEIQRAVGAGESKDIEITASVLSQIRELHEKGDQNNEPNTENVSGNVVQYDKACELPKVENKDTGASSSASQSRSRDVRLHWDLNMDMEEWERPPEEDTGTFSGLDLGFHTNAGQSNDPGPAMEEHITTSNVVSDLLSTRMVEARLEVELKGGGNKDAIMEDPEFVGESYALSTDAGSVESKHCIGAQGFQLASKALCAKKCLDMQDGQLQDEELEASGAHSSSKVLFSTSVVNLENVSESSLHERNKLDSDDYQKVGMGEGLVMGTATSKGAVVDLPKDFVNFNSVVDSVANGNSGKDARNGGRQYSPSASFLELGQKSLSDADFSGTSDLTKSKIGIDDLHTGGDSSVEETANNENQVVSADNYDFVEYDVTDDEDEKAPELEKIVSSKSDGHHNAFPGHRSPQEWNEDPVEAEHVDYDDSDFRDGDEAGSEAEERAESEWKDKGRHTLVEQEGGAKQCGVDVELEIMYFDKGVLRSDSDLEFATGAQGSTLKSGDVDFQLKNKSVQEPDIVDKQADDILLKRPDENVNEQGEAADSQSSENVEGAAVRDGKCIQDKDASTPGSSARPTQGQSRLKSTGWDQLPEGFDKVEDALRAAKENPAARSGRGSPWVTANGRGINMSTCGGPLTNRFGRGVGRLDGSRDRTRSEENTWTREGHPRVQRVDEGVDISPRISSPRDLGRGRSHGRGSCSAIRDRGRMEPWMDSHSGPTCPWGPNRHNSPPGRFGDGFGSRAPTNAAAMAAAKVESNGFVVAPDGTVTKAGNSTRGPPRPFQSGGRNGRGAMFNMGRGGPGMNMGVGGINMGSLRVNMGMGRSMSMSPGMGLNMGMGMNMTMGVGPGLSVGIPGRVAPGVPGIVDRYSSPYGGLASGGNADLGHSSSGRRGRSHDDYSDSWSRQDDHSSSPRRRMSTSRWSRSRSQSRTPSRSNSLSKTRSPPRTRSPPKSGNSSGGAGGVLGKASRKRSLSPTNHKPETRGERGESPSCWSLPPSKFPLPPPPPKLQRSPPASLKRFCEGKKDGDRTRSRDQEREREREKERERPCNTREREKERERPCITRVRTPPSRTSPHVVHGSALMDERDRQLLAGIRHVSPVNTSIRSCEAPGSSVVATSQDLPPVASPVRWGADGNIEARRQSGDEGVDMVHVPKRDETGIKIEHRSIKEMSRGEREHAPRRDGARDDERLDISKAGYNCRDKDGRSSSSLKYNREGDDDVAPRRRRPS